jgi:hypothetical protein
MKTLMLISLCGCAALIAGCQKATYASQSPVPTADAPSARGCEVRYNAAVALAHRGSADAIVIDLLTELISEPQQMANFRTTLKSGQTVADEQAAREAVIGGLRAIIALHRKQPSLDLSGIRAAIGKLNDSASATVRNEAKATLLALDAR